MVRQLSTRRHRNSLKAYKRPKAAFPSSLRKNRKVRHPNSLEKQFLLSHGDQHRYYTNRGIAFEPGGMGFSRLYFLRIENRLFE